MEKISLEEIKSLQEKADQERKIHREIIEVIENFDKKSKFGQYEICETLQLTILQRERKDEIMPLLKAYSKTKQGVSLKEDIPVFSSAFQKQLYEKREILSEAYNYMLENCVLCFEIEKKLIDSNSSHVAKEKSKQGEVYLINKTFEISRRHDSSFLLDRISAYFHVSRFTEAGEIALVKNVVDVKSGRDSFIDASINLIKDYVSIYGYFCAEAEIALVESNSNELITLYLENSTFGIKDERAVEKLLERANRQEVELYFSRYSKL